MNAREIKRALAAADPLGGVRATEVERLDFEAMEAELLADVVADGTPAGTSAAPGGSSSPLDRTAEPTSTFELPRARRRPPRLALGAGAVAIAAAVAVVVVLSGGGSGHPTPAFGAEQIRFAESTPLLLLEGPGWRVQEVTENRTRGGHRGADGIRHRQAGPLGQRHGQRAMTKKASTPKVCSRPRSASASSTSNGATSAR